MLSSPRSIFIFSFIGVVAFCGGFLVRSIFSNSDDSLVVSPFHPLALAEAGAEASFSIVESDAIQPEVLSAEAALEIARPLLRRQTFDDQLLYLQVIQQVSPEEWFDFVQVIQEEPFFQVTSNRFHRGVIVARSIQLRETVDVPAFLRRSTEADYWHLRDLLNVVNFRTVFDWMPHLSSHPRGRALFSNSVHRIGRFEPDQAVDLFLQNHERFGGSWEPMLRFLRQMASSDPDRALALFYEYIPVDQRAQQIGRLFSSQIVSLDLASALALIDGIGTPTERRNASASLLVSWARENPQETLSYLAELSDGAEKNRLIRRASWTLAREADPGDLVQWAVEHAHGQSRSNLISQTFDRLAADNPQHALALVETIPFGESHANALRSIARTWSQTDGNAAFEWASSLPAGRERTRAIDAVLSNFAPANAPAAIAAVLSGLDGSEDAHLRMIGQALAREDPAEALRTIAMLESDTDYESAIRGVIRGWAENDPLAAIDLIEREQLHDLVEQDISYVLSRWSNFDPAAAAIWTQNLEDPTLRSNAIRSVASNWLRHDTYAASEWIGSLPPDAARDSAIQNLVNSIREADPEAALLWSLEYSNESNRITRTRQAVTRLNDPARARQLIADSPLSSEQRTQLLDQLQLSD